jgi:SOS-response transcriptional repressor LexA
MQTDDLPERFVVEVPDDSLAPNLARGTAVVFEKASAAQPGECVLVQDSRGARYVRRYVQGVGGSFTAQALNDAYVTLDSGRDGLQILAVMAWRAERRV